MRLILTTALVMMAFAANSVLNRVAVGIGGMDPFGFALIRLMAGAAMLVGLVGLRALVRGRPIWPGWQGRGAGVLGLLLYLVGFSMAYVDLDAGIGALILFGLVQITMFAGAVLTREPVPAARWFGAALAFAGLLVLVAPGAEPVALWPAGSMALAGVGWGIFSLAGRDARDPLAATAANFGLALILALGMVVVAAVALPPAVEPGRMTGHGIGLAIVSGAVTSGLGYALWYRVLPELGAARAGVAQLTVPVLAGLAGAIALAEPLGLRFGLASLLVLGGVGWAALAGRRA